MLLSKQSRSSGASQGVNGQSVNRADVLRALTPNIMVLVGGLIGVMAIAVGGDAAAFGLAGTAIAGAAGLSQAHEPNSRRLEETLGETKTEHNYSGESK